MKKTIFLISIFAILINSCKKDSEKINVVFKGRVIDYYSGIGLSNAIIYIKNVLIDPNKSQLRQLDLYDTTFISGKVITDINGNFYKSLLLDKGSYKMIVYNNIFISLISLIQHCLYRSILPRVFDPPLCGITPPIKYFILYF